MRFLVIQVFATLLAREHGDDAISTACRHELFSVSEGGPVHQGHAIFLSPAPLWFPGYFWPANGYTVADGQVATDSAQLATGRRHQIAPAPSVPPAEETAGRQPREGRLQSSAR